ncbi:MAG: TIM-barrel domain-containing protein [Ignavibacteriaceae bacterium]|jgi:alpha-glucosidase (family GH31 glycosyl hydrolase)
MIFQFNSSAAVKIFFLMFFVFICWTNHLIAQAVIHHSPLGYENIYLDREVDISLNNCEREPRDPVENEDVLIKFITSPIFNKQECFADVILNGQPVKTFRAEFQYNHTGESYWKVNIGKYAKGDSVGYSLRINYNDRENTKSVDYNFITYGWDYLTDVKSAKFSNNNLILSCSSTNATINPVIQISFNTETLLKLGISFNNFEKINTTSKEKCLFRQSEGKAILSNSKLNLEINYKPFRLKLVSKETNKEVVKQFTYVDHSSVGFLNNNVGILKVRENFYSADDEMFFGFGERYNSINQRGNGIDNYVVNTWKDQGLRTYIPVPFYFTNKNYGFFLNTTYYSRFNLDTDKTNRCEIIANFGRKFNGEFQYFLFAEEKPSKIISSFATLTGKSDRIPVWTLGPWISANEWDKQIEIEAQIDSLKKYNIPNTVVVIEAWSDEETFYIFNDAIYKPKLGSNGFSLKDFKFAGRWPDPVGMISNLHKDNMKLVLWNIPVLKSSSVQNEQRDIDEKYAIEKNFVVKNVDGSPFRIPPTWFGNSLNLDFTNKDASNWWMKKRRYLVEEMKIDGFKCDGGEFIWGRDLIFSDGRKGEEMRNLYPNLYVDAYYKLIKSVNKDAAVFHRAGTFGAQKHPLAWNGDQCSSFPAFKEAIRSCLNSSISGISFIAYDIAGYHDETNLSPELYKRSLAQAAFSPVMQLHSAYSGDADLERTPWNIARMYNDPSCIDVYKKFANVRFNLIPYLFSETVYTSETGIPFMHPLLLDYPLDKNVLIHETDYMLGRNLLICPVTEPGTKKEIYLPEGEWFDLWSFKRYKGKTNHQFDVPDDHLPVFIKNGSITPLNLNKNFQLASGMTNELNSYNNLSFIVIPEKMIEYNYSDYVEGKVKKIKVSSENGKMILEIPPFKTSVSFIVNIPSVKEVLSSGKIIDASVNWEEFLKSNGKYFYSIESNMLYVRLNAAKGKRIIVVKTN